jgi:hypothetical protein
LAQASTYCVTLQLAGFDDWRLPSEKELLFIVDDTKTEDFSYDVFFDDPAIVDADLAYWSSTFLPDLAGQNMIVPFLTGETQTDSDSSTNRVRCVRP